MSLTIDPSNDRPFTMPSLSGYATALTALETTHRRRTLRTFAPLGQVNPAEPMETVTPDGHRLLCFSSNDYLGYSLRPELRQAAAETALSLGVGVGASRLISGTTPLAMALEAEIAAWKGTEAALVFPSGFQANHALLTALCGPGDLILADKLVHASLIDGMVASGAQWVRYKHRDMADLTRKLAKGAATTTGHCWVVTESVFSMDGDWPELAELGQIAAAHGAFVLVDEAHGAGVFGDRGQGLAAHQMASGLMTLQMGTFSKALGSAGAYVAGPQVLIDYLVNKARGFIYTTGLPLPVIAANRAAIALVQPDRVSRDRLWQTIHYLTDRLSAIPTVAHRLPPVADRSSPILPIHVGSDEQALAVSQALWEQGLYVPAIRPPTVAVGSARLRVCLSASHSLVALDRLAQGLAGVFKG